VSPSESEQIFVAAKLSVFRKLDDEPLPQQASRDAAVSRAEKVLSLDTTVESSLDANSEKTKKTKRSKRSSLGSLGFRARARVPCTTNEKCPRLVLSASLRSPKAKRGACVCVGSELARCVHYEFSMPKSQDSSFQLAEKK